MKMFFKKAVAVLASICCMLSAMPQLVFTSAVDDTFYEAEDASYTDNSVYQQDDASGGECVGRFTSSTSRVDFTVTVEKSGYYDVTVCAKGVGAIKYNKLVANGTSYGEFFTEQDVYSEDTVKQVYLNKGANTISVTESWGWIYLDWIKVIPAEIFSDNRYNVSKELINPDATDSAKRLMSYLVDNYGTNVLTGQQADNGYNANEITAIYNTTGEKPAVIGLDLMAYSLSSVTQHGSNGNSMNIAKQVDAAGGIVTMCWHWRMYDEYLLSGTADDGNPRWWQAFYTKNIDSSKFNLADIMNNPSSEGYKKILADIDYAAEQLKTLQDANIPVLFRPLHEASGGWFWWGAYGADAYKKLWVLMYDRMTNYHGLNNLIWVWNGQHDDWYPGDEYCDIMGEDIYTDKHNYTPQASKFVDVANRSEGNKIVTLSENGVLFDIDLAIEANTLWSWFCVWGGSFTSNGSTISTSYTSVDMWKKVYQHEHAITLDELPDLKTYPLDGGSPSVPDDSSAPDESSSVIVPDDSSSVTDSSTPDDSTPSLTGEKEIWVGSASFPSWTTKEVTLGYINIPEAVEGGILSIYLEAEDGAQVQIPTKQGTNWTWSPLKNENGNTSFDVTSNGRFDIVLSAENAELLRTAREILIKGQKFSVTKVTYSSPATDDSSSVVEPDDSSAPDDSSTPDITDTNEIKYQLADNASKVRFIWIVDEEAVTNAKTGSITLEVSPDVDAEPIGNTTAITNAYRSLYAAGQVITAPEGKVFIISPITHNLTETTAVTCRFMLDSLSTEYTRAYEP